jgi:hypothetical protein
MNDMSDVSPRRSGASLRFFDRALGLLTVLLTLVSLVLVLVMVASLPGGSGQFVLDARVEPPYTVRLLENRSIAVDASGNAQYVNFRFNNNLHGESPRVDTRVYVDQHDTDTRIVLIVAVGVLLAITWLGLVNLRRVVRSARAGDPFAARNASRLRWLATAFFTAAVAVRVLKMVVDHTLDADVPVHVVIPGPSWLVLSVIGLGFLALAEVFREGHELRALEQATI